MNTAGIDVGSLWTKVVIVREGEILSSASILTGDDNASAAENALGFALKKVDMLSEDLDSIFSTGQGRKEVKIADGTKAEAACHAKGAHFLFPNVRTVIDIGAESSRAIRVSKKGKVEDFVQNDKCASGTGLFLDVIAKLMELDVSELGKLSLKAKRIEEITSMCTVFAESEVISSIHRRVPREEIIAGVHESIAKRIYGMVSRIGIEDDVVMSGGVSNNVGVVNTMSKMLERKIFIPEDPQLTGALGAALIAGGRK